MKINIYKTSILFLIIQSLLIVLLLNNNYMKRFSFFQSSNSNFVDMAFGLLILVLNLIALVVVRYLYISGLEAERLKLTSLKHAHMVEQTRIYRQHHHDLKNHLTVVMGLLKLGKYPELNDYLESYLDTVNDALLKIETGLDEIDVLLSSKIQLAKNKDIRVELKNVASLRSSKKHVLDLVTILGNVLNNALEAVEDFDSPMRKVCISIQRDPLEYIFEISNPMLLSNISDADYFREGFSTKQEGRGQGLFIVKRLTERLDGNVSINCSDGIFKVTIEIPRHRLEEE
ncbi:MAG: GHKL domain-containing protein [Peptococcaceae bacterium]|nr:GHKL domain-containing protein [Peptococcaceae bacterium]